MAYQTYTTDALVCGSYDRNTSDRSHLLFARDAGMLYADARSVREERSKQRFALQDFSLVRVSLVKGRRGWRVGSVESQGNFYFGTDVRRERIMVVRLMKFLKRFVHGHDLEPAAFDDTVATLSRLSSLSSKEQQGLVTIYEYRLLYRLGYVAPLPQLAPLLTTGISDLELSTICQLPSAIESVIDTAVSSSHL